MTDEIDDVEGAASKSRMGRRDVLKKGAVGAGVAGVVWAAPEIIGLSTSPAYAAASSHSVSNQPCSGDANFAIKIPCPPDGHLSKDLVIASGNCPPQVITVDSHWAVGTPKDATADRPNAFNDIHAQDKAPWKTYHAGGNSDLSNDRPPYLITSIKRANAHCSFTAATFNGTNTYLFNPVTKQKFNGAFATASDVSIGWASDPNERADLGQPFCGDGTSATVTMHCM